MDTRRRTTLFEYIDSVEALQRMVARCGSADVVAMDTEFARFNTYYPIVGLIQVFDGKDCFLIDPLTIENLSPLGELLAKPDLLKVFHACSEDMEVFQHAVGTTPSPVFDTQIASAALGVGFSMGYQALVDHYLDITLPKDQTRSDWLTRPLSHDQLDYAALDVIHLREVYERQIDELDGTPKLQWIEDESAELGKDIPTLIDPESCYKKMKGLWQLNRKQLNVLKALCAWHEVTARKENVPRNRVVEQKSLMVMARENLTGKQALQSVAGMTPRQVRKYGEQLLFLQAEARLVPEADCPELVKKPEAPVNKVLMKKLRAIVEEKARSLSVAPELLTRRRHLEKLIRSEDESGRYHLPGELGGWRKNVIGQELLSALAD